MKDKSIVRKLRKQLNTLEDELKQDPGNSEILYNKGNILLELERYEDALNAYEASLELNPGDAEVICSKGNALFGLKRYEEALKIYDEALKIKTDYVEARDNKFQILDFLGTTFLEKQRHEKALEIYEMALEMSPENADLWFTKGRILSGVERYEEALESYKEGLKIEFDNPQIWYEIGEILAILERFDEALKAYTNSAELWGGSEDEKSLIAYEKSLVIRPDDAKLWYKSATSLSRCGNNGKALDNFIKAAKLYEQSKMYVEALEAYEKAVGLNPEDSKLFWKKGNMLNCLRKHSEAVTTYKKALEIKKNVHETLRVTGTNK